MGLPTETVTVVVNGQPFQGWLEVHVDQGIDKAAGQATVKISELRGVPMPIKLGDKVQVLIGATPVITGFVHEFQGEIDKGDGHGPGHHWMTCTVRDQTQDFIDSTVGPKLKLKTPIALKQVLRQTLDTMGLGHIGVVDHVNPDPYKAGEVVSAAIDDRGYAFGDLWAQKRQVLLGTDGKGNLTIDRNRRVRAGGALISLFEDSPLNNVKKSSFRNSDKDRHNTHAVNGQKSTTDREHWESKSKGEATAQADRVQKDWGAAHDTGVRSHRRLHTRGGKGLSGATPKKTAKWRSNVAKGRGFQYTATVQGFYMQSGGLWWPNRIIQVVDQHWELEGEFLICDVRFQKTWTGGAITDVTVTLPDAYTEDDEGPKANQRTSKLGLGGGLAGSFPPVSDADMGIA